jgi:hypothetical protein
MHNLLWFCTIGGCACLLESSSAGAGCGGVLGGSRLGNMFGLDSKAHVGLGKGEEWCCRERRCLSHPASRIDTARVGAFHLDVDFPHERTFLNMDER